MRKVARAGRLRDNCIVYLRWFSKYRTWQKAAFPLSERNEGTENENSLFVA